jgi:hypothetical protein
MAARFVLAPLESPDRWPLPWGNFPSACFYGKTINMKKSIVVKPKRGRPSTGGRDPFVGIRLPKDLIDEIDAWTVKHESESRSEGIRRLVELGLKVKGK